MKSKFIPQMDSVIKCIEDNNIFVVTSHVSPDGDNIGSTLGMYRFLEKLGKKVYHVLDDDIPSNLVFLSKKVEKISSTELEEDNYVMIALDCGDEKRICTSDDVKKNAIVRVCIDHHASNDSSFCEINYIDSEASSTCELVYNIIRRYGDLKAEDYIDEVIATRLYTGLSTDTGNFQYSSTEPSSFEMAKVLLEHGAERDMIIQKLYQSNSPNYYRLLGDALNTLSIAEAPNGQLVASICVSIDMMKKHSISYNDIDGVTTYTRDIENVEVGIFLKEKRKGEIKISLRSKNDIDVSKIAMQFNGGGHVRAAGCTINDTIENAEKIIKERVLRAF